MLFGTGVCLLGAILAKDDNKYLSTGLALSGVVIGATAVVLSFNSRDKVFQASWEYNRTFAR